MTAESTAPDIAAPLAPVTAAPVAIGALAMHAAKETSVELSASARRLSSVGSAALRRLRLNVERSFGIEVDMDDPALRDLFGHLLQVQTCLTQAQLQATALLEATASMAEGAETYKFMAGSLAMLKQAGCTAGAASSSGGSSSSTSSPAAGQLPKASGSSPAPVPVGAGTSELPAAEAVAVRKPTFAETVDKAYTNTYSQSMNASDGAGSARCRMERRINEEVLDVIQAQLDEFERLRQQFRKRVSWREQAERARAEVAALQKSRRYLVASARRLLPGSQQTQDGDVRVGGFGSCGAASTLESAQERMQEAQAKAAALDTDLLSSLLQIRKDSRSIAARPWAVLARIQVDFFATLAGTWAPIATEALHGVGTDSNADDRYQPVQDAEIEVSHSATAPDGDALDATALSDASSGPCSARLPPTVRPWHPAVPVVAVGTGH